MTEKEKKILKKMKKTVKKMDKLNVYPDGDGDSVVDYYELMKIKHQLKKLLNQIQ